MNTLRPLAFAVLLLLATLAAAQSAAGDEDAQIEQLRQRVDALQAAADARAQGKALAAMIEVANLGLLYRPLSERSSSAALFDFSAKVVRSMQDACWTEVVPLCPRALRMPPELRTHGLLECMQSPLNAADLSTPCQSNLTAALHAAWQSRVATHALLRDIAQLPHSACTADLVAVCPALPATALQPSFYDQPPAFLPPDMTDIPPMEEDDEQRTDDTTAVSDQHDSHSDDSDGNPPPPPPPLSSSSSSPSPASHHGGMRGGQQSQSQPQPAPTDPREAGEGSSEDGWDGCEVEEAPMFRALSCLEEHFDQLSSQCQLVIAATNSYDYAQQSQPTDNCGGHWERWEPLSQTHWLDWAAPLVLAVVVIVAAVAIICKCMRCAQRRHAAAASARATAASAPAHEQPGSFEMIARQPEVAVGAPVKE